MHFEFIFLRGVKGGMVSFFFYLHLSVQCSQHHLFKRLSLSHCINLSCLSSFWECVKKIFFLFEKPTKSLIVIVSKSLIKQPTDRYSSVPSLTKCRFLHNYQCTKNNVDRIWPHPSTNQKGQVKSQHCPSETVCSVSLYKSLYHRPMIRFTDSLVILDTKYICCEQWFQKKELKYLEPKGDRNC